MAENAGSIEDRISAALGLSDPEPEAPQAPPVQQRQAPQAEEVEYEEAPAEEVEAAPEPTAEAEEETEIESLDQLAEHLGVEVGDLYNIKFGATDASGNRIDLSIGELKDVAQKAEKVRKAEAEIAEIRQQVQRQQQAQLEAMQRAEHERSLLLDSIEQKYLADFAQVDWRTLEAQDPGRAALAHQHFEARRNELIQMRNQAAAEYSARERQFYAELVQKEAERVQRESKVLEEKWPEWRDSTKRAELDRKLSAFLLAEGYSEDQIYGRRLPDGSRVGGLNASDILLARDAMAWRELQGKSEVAKRRVVRLGKKVLTAGPRQATAQQAQANEQSMRNRLKRSGKLEDAAALIQSRLGR